MMKKISLASATLLAFALCACTQGRGPATVNTDMSSAPNAATGTTNRPEAGPATPSDTSTVSGATTEDAPSATSTATPEPKADKKMGKKSGKKHEKKSENTETK